jgi:transcriptional regulator
VDEANTDVIQGTLDMLILKTLSLEPMHGFGIARRIEQISQEVFKINPGSLLTALQRLERGGWLDAEWRVTENSRRAKVYKLTRAGGVRCYGASDPVGLLADRICRLSGRGIDHCGADSGIYGGACGARFAAASGIRALRWEQGEDH